MNALAASRILRIYLSLALIVGFANFSHSLFYAQEAPAESAAAADPTEADEEMEEVIRALRASQGQPTDGGANRNERLSLAGLVVGGRQDPSSASGTAIFQVGESYFLAREGQTVQAGGKTYLLKTANSMQVVVEESGGGDLVLRSQDPKDTSGGSSATRDIAVIEMDEVPLHLATRALSDESGIRIAASQEANQTNVSIYLRNVDSREALDTLALTHQLYMTAIPGAEVVRLHTTEEYARDAGSFRDEITKVFTLKYPNARDVALSINDLYGDRVQLAERLDDQGEPGEHLTEDLQQRLERFDIIDARGQGFGIDTGGGGGGGGFGGAGGFQGGRSLSNNFSNNRTGNSRSFGNQTGSGASGSIAEGDRFTVEDELSPEEIAALESGDPRVIAQIFQQRADIYVTVIDRLNKVMVRTRDEKTMAEISDLVLCLDVPTPLVLLEVRILEVALERGLDTAFDWNVSSSQWNGGFSTSSPVAAGDLVFTYLDNAFQTQIDMLQRGNKLTVLGKPMLLTANNEVSRLFIGEEVPLNRNFGGGQDFIDGGTIVTGTATTDIEFRPVGSTLFITPNINQDRTVSLRVLQEESRIVEDGAEILVPGPAGGFINQTIDTVASQTASGTFVARDQETIAIGGMITERISSQRSQIPVLGDIPAIGILARNQSLDRVRTEIVLLLKPHIIKTPGEGEPVTRNLVPENSYHPNAPTLGEGELGAFVRPNVVTTGSE
ncbi:MAG: hypothetical protein AAGC68_03025, partial [Verrucomicrobiota bacterium]